MASLAELPLESFLGCCRGDWGPKELKAVQRKLAAIGVEDVDALLRSACDGSLNEKLEDIGEKRFTGDTLDAMRSAGAQLGAVPQIGQSGHRSSAAEEQPTRPFTGNSMSRSLGHWRVSRQPDEDEEDATTIRQQICRGLSKMDAMASEAKRRNGEVTRCLAEVQADIVRMTQRMSDARQRNGRSSSYHDPSCGNATASRINGRATASTPKRGSMPSAFQSGPVQPPSGTPFAVPPSGKPFALPRRPGSEHRPRRQPSELRGGGAGPRPVKEATGTRGMQSGFTFGATEQQQRPLRAPPLRDAGASLAVSDPACQAQEAVRNQLLGMRGRPENDKKAYVKSLLVKWHPDRNPESTEVATSVFQYIQQEKERILDL